MERRHYHYEGIRVLKEIVLQAIPAGPQNEIAKSVGVSKECRNGLLPAGELSIEDFRAAGTAAASKLRSLLRIILQVCPNCLAKQRKDHAWIFVPPERQFSRQNKNLITVWLESSGLRLRIMPAPEESFERERLGQYKARLNRLYKTLLKRAD
jgi:hypothetical protein